MLHKARSPIEFLARLSYLLDNLALITPTLQVETIKESIYHLIQAQFSHPDQHKPLLFWIEIQKDLDINYIKLAECLWFRVFDHALDEEFTDTAWTDLPKAKQILGRLIYNQLPISTPRE